MNHSSFITSRRAWLRQTSAGFGAMALNGLLHAASNPLAVRAPLVQPRAKRVIFLFMAGGPSQMDLFDPKPLIQQRHGKPVNAPMPEQHRHVSTDGLLALGRLGGLRARGSHRRGRRCRGAIFEVIQHELQIALDHQQVQPFHPP